MIRLPCGTLVRDPYNTPSLNWIPLQSPLQDEIITRTEHQGF